MYSYAKTRKVIGLILNSDVIKNKYNSELKGNVFEIGTNIINEIINSEIDVEIIEELSDKKANEIDFPEGVQLIADFFTDIQKSWKTLEPLLKNIELKAVEHKKTA